MEPSGPWASTFVRTDDAVSGRWHAHVDDVWTLAVAPLGGITAAVAGAPPPENLEL